MRIWVAGGGTGGHLYPGLAIARALVEADPRVQPFFIGAERGIERDVLPKAGFPYELLDLHPLYRSKPWRNWRTIIGGLGAWRRIAAIARDNPPRALIATGGYVAGVALAYASRHRIPIVIQEQNSHPGATVRWFAKRARQIHLGFLEASASLHVKKGTQLFDSGNPIDPLPVPRPTHADANLAWGFPDDGGKTLLVFGGSQGAEAINAAMADWLWGGGDRRLGIRVIWSTGKNSYDRYKHLNSATICVRPFITPMASAYAAADLAICRAGAMTLAELAAWGIPSVLIPLPTAAADHQTANAQTMETAGASVMIPQPYFSPKSLDAALNELLMTEGKLDEMHHRALERGRPDAAHVIAQQILRVVDSA